MRRQRLSRFAAGALVAGLTTTFLAALAVTTRATSHADPVQDHNATVFYAVGSSDGSTLTVAGLVQYDPGTTIGLDANVSDACSDEGANLPDPPLTVTTNSAGYAYFAETLPTYGYTDDVVQILSTDGGSTVSSNCYPVGADNTAWENAATVALPGGAGSVSGLVGVSGESRWYKISPPPDTTVTITLSNLSADYDVTAYSNIGAGDTDLSGGVSSLDQLAQESPTSAFSPSAFIPSAFIPSAFIPSAFIPSAFIPSAFIPSAFIPSAFIPSAFIPSDYSPSAFIPSAFIPSDFVSNALTPSNYSTAQPIPAAFTAAGILPSAFNPQTYLATVNQSLIAYSDEDGTANKSVTINTYDSPGPFYIRVAGVDGASDNVDPFQLSITGASGACPSSVTPIGSAPAAAASTGAQTVILTDSSRVAGSTQSVANMMTQLNALAARPEVKGVVVDVAGNARIQALDAQAAAHPTCVFAENLVADALHDIVDSYRANNPLKYVVLAGPDAAIPYFRHPDQTLIGNETGYNPPLGDDNAQQTALQEGYTLSDNDYGAQRELISQNDTFGVPDLAVGRLVESADEISGMLAAYLGNSAGVLPTPSSALVTGYDFLTLPAQSVESDLSAGLGQTSTDTLIEPRTDAPAASWTATQLKQKVLNSGRHDIVFLAGHFSANDTLAADYSTDMITTDMEQSSVNLKNALVFSAGCHSGYNIDDASALPGVTLTLDWPEEFARKQATFIGGTGYQYGDTNFIAYSEAIYADFAHQLRLGTGPVSIGQALVAAKQDYLASTPSLDAIGQKAVYEAELYGLPMESINLPDGRITAPQQTSVISGTSPVGSDPGTTLGLRTASVTVTPHLTMHTTTVQNVANNNSSVNTTYYSGDNGTVIEPYQPVLPLENEDVSVPGQSLRGALFLGGSYTDTSGIVPLTGAPATEIRGVDTGFSSTTFFPEKPWTINYYNALDGNSGGATQLMVTPVQHTSDPSPATTDTRRTFNSMNFKLFYSANTSTYGTGGSAVTPALTSAPSIVSVESTLSPDGTGIDICATIGAQPSSGVQQAVVTYTDPTAASPTWSSATLTSSGCNTADDWFATPTDSSSFGGTIPLAGLTASNVQFLVQAVSGTGLVSTDDNLGAYFSLTPPRDSFPQATFTNLSASVTSAAFGTPVTVSADVNGTFGAGPVTDEPIVFTIGSQSAIATTDGNGHVTATISLDLPPGTYPLGAAVDDPSYYNSTSTIADAITVTRQPSLISLAPTSGSLPTGDTSYTATLCATGGTTCDSTTAPISDRTVVFELSGPVTRTVAEQTTAYGQARFDAYGLPPGSYTLTAYFEGAIPGVGTLTDSYYGPAAPAVATFATTTSYTTAPTLHLPANISVSAGTNPGTVVSYVVSATDPIDPRPQVVCTPGSVAFFAVGTTTVHCTATDTAGNSATGSFTVTVLGASATVTVSGTQQYGAAPTFHGVSGQLALSGTLTCTTLSNGTAIRPTLAVGSYQINPASCSGLSGPAGVTLKYTSAPLDFTVTRAVTTLTVSPAGHGPLLLVVLSARLTRTDSHAPIAGQRVSFAVQGRTVCTATTNANGVASCALVALVIATKPLTYSATYAATADYAASSGQAPLGNIVVPVGPR